MPCSMCNEIYDNCASPKRRLIVEGAAHAESYYKDMEAYEKALTEFAEEVMGPDSLFSLPDKSAGGEDFS